MCLFVYLRCFLEAFLVSADQSKAGTAERPFADIQTSETERDTNRGRRKRKRNKQIRSVDRGKTNRETKREAKKNKQNKTERMRLSVWCTSMYFGSLR